MGNGLMLLKIALLVQVVGAMLLFTLLCFFEARAAVRRKRKRAQHDKDTLVD